MIVLKKCLLLSSAAFVLAVTISVTSYLNVRGADQKTKKHVRLVLVAYWTADFDGGYWENELLNQWKEMANSTVDQKLQFLSAVVERCDLDTTSALAFAKIANPYASKLIELLQEKLKIEDNPHIKKRLEKQAVILALENGFQKP